MGVKVASKMFLLSSMLLSTLFIASEAVSPLTSEELRQIRDFTAKAHMKRLQNFPDQLMTPSHTQSHYLGRRIPAEKQPTFFMQAPSNNVPGIKPTPFQIEPQQAGAVQNYLVNYPITTSTIVQQQQQQQQQQQRQQQQQQQQHQQQQQQQQQQQVFQQQRPQQHQFQFGPAQNAGPFNGPPRGPPPPPPHYKRPSFFSFGGPESSPPSSLLQFFFPKRSARRPPSYRQHPIRFEYAQSAHPAHNPALLQHQQNLHSIMAQQHLLAVQQQSAQSGQQSGVQPSASPAASQSTTIKTGHGAHVNPTVVSPQAAPPAVNSGLVAANHANAQLLHQHQHQHFIPSHHPHGPPPPPFFNVNQFHREVQYFGKPVGKHAVQQKFPQVTPAYVPQNRPGDEINYIQKYAQPQPDFNFLPLGPHLPPVIAGPTSNRFVSPVSFSNIEQMPFSIHQSQPLPMHMVVQSQEFPHYHFTTTFTANSADATPPVPSSTPESFVTNHLNSFNNAGKHQQKQVQVYSQQAVPIETTTVRQTHRVKKVRPRPTTTIPTSTVPPTTTQSLGDIIFESAKETREFHDSAHVVPPTISNSDYESVVNTKPRKPKQQKAHQQNEHAGSQPKASVDSSNVVHAPVIFTESIVPLYSTTSPRPITSTLVSVSTASITTTQAPTNQYHKAKVTKSKGDGDFHKSKNNNNNSNNNNHRHHSHHYEKRVTASGSGLGAATPEPLRITSTGISSSATPAKSTPSGRVVTTSVTSRVVSIGPQNPQKRYRLRKVKVPNPEAIKANSNKTSTTSSFSSSSSSSTTTIPSSTTPISTRTPRSTTTISSTSPSTESSLTTTEVQ